MDNSKTELFESMPIPKAVVTLSSDVNNDVLKSAVTNEGYEVVEIK